MKTHLYITAQTHSQPSVGVTGASTKPVEDSTSAGHKTSVVVVTEVQPSPSLPLPPQPSVSSSPGSSFLEPLSIAAFVAVVIAVTRR